MNEIEELYDELRRVELCPLDYLPDYGYSPKEEVIQLIKEDIQEAENELYSNECDYTDEELEKERTQLCVSQGISRFC